MINLTWGKIREPSFQSTLHKMRGTALPFKLSYHLSRIFSKIETEAKESTAEYIKIVKRLGDLDEATGAFKIKDEHKDEWAKEVEAFMKHEFSIDKRKILVAELPGDVKLTPEDIMGLDFLFSDLEALEGGANG